MQKDFWIAVEAAKKVVRRKNPVITTEELEMVRDRVEEFFGTRPSESFVQVCAHLTNPTAKAIIQVLNDLQGCDWTYETVVARKTDRAKTEPNDAFDIRDGGPQYASTTVARYPRKIDPMNIKPDLGAFLRANFHQLTHVQKNTLSSFQPGRMSFERT